jgi:flagellar biosynthesis chaperone FliJ
MSVITPMQVETRLKDLSKLIDEAHDKLVDSEMMYHQAKADYEIAMAKTRLDLARRSSPTGKNYTVGEREDMAIAENQELHRQVAQLEAIIKADRANVARLKVQVDIARSIGTSVRTGMDI